MSLTWHMVRKDFRRLCWPLGLWLALVLAQTLLVLDNPGPRQQYVTSYEGFSYFATLWGVIVGAVGFILAAWLVMEDSLVGTEAHWQTRPISGARLLAAKMLGAFLMFSVLPAVILTPVWLWCGFSAGEWAGAAGDTMARQAVFSVAAFALASVTATSGQFLVRMMGLAVALPVYLGFVLNAFPRAWEESDRGLVESRYWLILGLFLLTPVVMLCHQFLTRITRRAVMIFGAGLVLMLGVRLAWSWDFSSLLFRLGSDAQAAVADPAVKFEVKLFHPHEVKATWRSISWSGEMTGIPPGAYLRLDSAGGTILKADQLSEPVGFVVTAGRVAGPSPEAVRAAAGLPAGVVAPAVWSIESHEPVNKGRLQAELRATMMRGRVLGELPLRNRAELQVGSSHTRIKLVEHKDGRLDVYVHERDAGLGVGVGFYRRFRRPAVDVFILLNRAQAYEQIPDMLEIGMIRANSVMVGRRRLSVTPPTRLVDGVEQEIPGWEEGLVLVKVRFVPDRPLSRIISN